MDGGWDSAMRNKGKLRKVSPKGLAGITKPYRVIKFGSRAYISIFVIQASQEPKPCCRFFPAPLADQTWTILSNRGPIYSVLSASLSLNVYFYTVWATIPVVV